MKSLLRAVCGMLLTAPLHAADTLGFMKPASFTPGGHWRTLTTLLAFGGVATLMGWRRRRVNGASPGCRVVEKIPLSRHSTLFRIEYAGREYLLADNQKALAWLAGPEDTPHVD